MDIQTISSSSSLLPQVIELGTKNSKTLGHFPEGAFIEHAKKNLILACEHREVVIGYLLYRIAHSKRQITIVHLCVESTYRNQGVAKKLLDELISRNRKYFNGISLSCRKDYVEASKFYQKNGFLPRKEVRCRSKEEKYLVKWFLPFGNQDLFSGNTDSDPRIKIGLDASVIFKLMDSDQEVIPEVAALMDDWLYEEVDYYYAPELFNEINRDADQQRANATREFLNHLTEINFLPHEEDAVLVELVSILPGNSQNDISDRKQIAECVAGGLSYFVTRDITILEAREEIYSQFAIRIFSPAEIILHIDQLKNKSDYYSLRVAGANYDAGKIESSDVDAVIDDFLNLKLQEKRYVLRDKLAALVADVKKHSVKVIKNSSGQRIGMYSTIAMEDEVVVEILRTVDSKVSAVLFKQMLVDIIHEAVKKGKKKIVVSEQLLSPEMLEILNEYGFDPLDGCWVKTAVKGQYRFDSLLTDNSGQWGHINPQMVAVQFGSTTVSEHEAFKYGLERKLWPIKFLDLDIPNYIIPIRSHWASELFDFHQANTSLFGSNERLSWQRENVYYRNVRPISEKFPARILWYVSQDANSPIGRSKGIVASSYLDEVHVGLAKELFQRFKHYGVYEWNHIYELVDQDLTREMKALKFSDTEVFARHVPLEIINNVFLKNNRPTNTFASPMEISSEIFHELYKIGKDS